MTISVLLPVSIMLLAVVGKIGEPATAMGYCNGKDVVREMESGPSTNMTFDSGDALYYNGQVFECLEYGWKDSIKATTSTTTSAIRSRQKRFVEWIIVGIGALIITTSVICVILCNSGKVPPNKTPNFSDCPTSIQRFRAERGKRDVVVKLKTPTAKDPEDGKLTPKLMKPIPSGSRFSEGKHKVGYIVKDSKGAEDYCYIEIEVTAKTCSTIPYTTDGHVSCDEDDFIYGSKCFLTCREGYKLSTSTRDSTQSIECILDSSGNPTYDVNVASCQVMSCSKDARELQVRNGEPRCGSSNLMFNTVCQTKCFNGYRTRTSAPRTTTCQHDGTWSRKLEDCYDVDPPVIKNCPRSFSVATERSSKFAKPQWTPPVAIDNAGSVQIKETKGLVPGSEFGIGRHRVVYQAVDEARNSALCDFYITVFERTCSPPFIDDIYMRYNCTSGYGYGASCQLSCLGTFPFVGNESISCELFEGDVDWTWDQTKQHCKRNRCGELDPPTNGAMSCAAWLFGQICQMQCSEPYDIPYGTTNDVGGRFTGQFVCSESMGKWTPSSVPDCSVRRSPNEVQILGKFFYYTGDCNNESILLTIKENFIENMKLVEASGFSGVCPNNIECNVDNVIVTCGNFTNRNKRDLYQEDLVKYRLPRKKRSFSGISVEFRIFAEINASIRLTLDSFQTLRGVLNNITSHIQDSLENGDHDIAGFKADPESFAVSQMKLSCPYGTFLRYNTLSCVPCPAGSVYNNETSQCSSCPVGTYKTNEMDLVCEQCPFGTSTPAAGAKNETECLGICKPGYYSRTGLEPCSPCPLSTYQNGSRSTSCIPCDSDKTTINRASQNATECKEFDYIFVNDDGHLDLGQVPNSLDTYTLLMWIQLSSTSCFSIIFSSPSATNKLFHYQSGQIGLPSQSDLEYFNVSIPEARWTLLCLAINFGNGEVNVFLQGESVLATSTSGLIHETNSAAEWQVSLTSGTNDEISITGLSAVDYIPTQSDFKEFAETCHYTHPRSLINMREVDRTSSTGIIKGVPSRCITHDPCEPNPCNGHMCSQVDDKFVCHCSDGYSGAACQIAPDYCANDPCENFVSCSNINGTFSCSCKFGFKGKRCTVPIINGDWSSWEPWTECSASCGGGNRTRERYCNSPPPDPDGKDCNHSEATETEACNVDECPRCGSLKRGHKNKLTCVITEDGQHECKVTCEAGYTFLENQMPDVLYICGPSTQYQWSNTPPSCSASRMPRSLSTQTTVAYSNVTCNDKADVRSQFEEKAKSQYRCVRNKTCSMELDISGCTPGQSNLDVTITLTAHFDSDQELEPVTSLENASQPVLDLINAVVDLEISVHHLNVSSNLTDLTLNDVTYTRSAIDTLGKVECSKGQGRIEATCVECPVGTFSENSLCELCDYGTYQDSPGQTQCKPCPTGFTTDILGTKEKSSCTEVPNEVPQTFDPSAEEIIIVTSDFPASSTNDQSLDKKNNEEETTILIVVLSVLGVVTTVVVVVAVKCYTFRVKHKKIYRLVEQKDESPMDIHDTQYNIDVYEEKTVNM